jgi:hypothetical protein
MAMGTTLSEILVERFFKANSGISSTFVKNMSIKFSNHLCLRMPRIALYTAPRK